MDNTILQSYGKQNQITLSKNTIFFAAFCIPCFFIFEVWGSFLIFVKIV